jgi:hypothetical protein
MCQLPKQNHFNNVWQKTRNKITDYWKESGIEKEDEFTLLANIIHQEITGLSVTKHNVIKGLTSQNLRNYLSEAELILPL